MKTLIKTLLVLSVLTLAMTLTPAQAGWFTKDPEDVCEQALATKPMESVVEKITEALKAWGRDAVQNVLSRVTGRGVTRPNRAVFHDADNVAAHIDPFLKAFEALAGRVIKIYYGSNTSEGWIRSAIPNINLRVPENITELVKSQFVVIRDTFSGDQIYVLPFFEKVGADGNVILDPSTGLPEQVAVYISPHNPEQGGTAAFSDIKEFEIVGKSDFDRSGRKDLLNVLEHTLQWGLLDNLRPGSMVKAWVAKGHTFQVIASAHGGIAVNTFINLLRATVDNTVRGKDFDLNEVFWNRDVPFADQNGRPLNLSAALRNDGQGIGNTNETINPEDPSTFGADEAIAVTNLRELLTFALREGLMTERTTYINALWEIAVKSKRPSVVRSVGELLSQAMTAAQGDFATLQNNLNYIAQKAESFHLDQWLEYRIGQMATKLGDGSLTGEAKAKLFARHKEFVELRQTLAQILAEAARWKISALDLVNTSSALATVYIPKLTPEIGRGDVVEFRDDPTFREFTAAIARIMNEVSAFEASEAQRTKQK